MKGKKLLFQIVRCRVKMFSGWIKSKLAQFEARYEHFLREKLRSVRRSFKVKKLTLEPIQLYSSPFPAMSIEMGSNRMVAAGIVRVW